MLSASINADSGSFIRFFYPLCRGVCGKNIGGEKNV